MPTGDGENYAATDTIDILREDAVDPATGKVRTVGTGGMDGGAEGGQEDEKRKERVPRPGIAVGMLYA